MIILQNREPAETHTHSDKQDIQKQPKNPPETEQHKTIDKVVQIATKLYRTVNGVAVKM